jgi:N-hydroxyarylamine O-acetyltransferase
MQHRLDVDAYLERIAYAGPREPTLAVLDAVHEAHLAAIPFENLDVRLHRNISLQLAHLEAKLVRGGRGGYCFEQNALLAAALGELGFRVRTLEARVGPEPMRVPPRTHMTLAVELPLGARLADVGFGTDGPLWTVPFDGTESKQPGGAWRVSMEDGAYVLQRRVADDWIDLYAFRPDSAFPVDFEVANHYTSTWPGSHFVQTATVQHTTARERATLRWQRYTKTTSESEETRMLSQDEAVRLVRERFGLRVSEAEARRAIGPSIAPASDSSLLVTFGQTPSPELEEEVWRLTRALRYAPPDGLLDLHPAYVTVLVRYDPRGIDRARLEAAIRAHLVLSRDEGNQEAPPLIEIPVSYGGEHGPDLSQVARDSGLTEEQVVAFLGFTAGFPYLSGLPERLQVPRLPTPRRLVPAGSVAIAGRQAGIYPQATPGGWKIIGRTSVRLFRPEGDPITLLRMGDRVRFVVQPHP